MSGLVRCAGCGESFVVSGNLCGLCLGKVRRVERTDGAKAPERRRDVAVEVEKEERRRGRTWHGVFIPAPPHLDDMAAFRRR